MSVLAGYGGRTSAALAVDDRGDYAHVISGTGVIAEVKLPELLVRYLPVAVPAGDFPGKHRRAFPLPDGRIVVFGYDIRTNSSGQAEREPAGIKLFDSSWRALSFGDIVELAVPFERSILGFRFNGQFVVGYDFGGKELFEWQVDVGSGERVREVYNADDVAYVTTEEPTPTDIKYRVTVLDPVAGSVVRRVTVSAPLVGIVSSVN